MLSPVDIKYFKLAVPGPYKESQVDIAAKCPICGDSKHKNSKRLHLYEKSGITLVNCFNGGCEMNSQRNLYNFLRFYKPELVFNYKSETFGNRISELKVETKAEFSFKLSDISETSVNSANVEFTEDSNTTETSVNTAYAVNSVNSESAVDTEVLKVPVNTWVYPDKSKLFLKSRHLDADLILRNFIYLDGLNSFNFKGKFYNTKNSIVFPFLRNSEVYGFNSRNFDTKIFINCSLIKDKCIWNFFNVDLSKRVYIFEGIIDALSFFQIYGESNIIALNTCNIPLETLKLIEKPVFCLDNDTTGLDSMLKYNSMSKDFEFLIYPDMIYKDFNDVLKNQYKFDLRIEKGFKASIELRKLKT